MIPNAKQIQLAALLGFLGVALGAFGAHGLEDTLKAHATVEIWKTASHYHLIHAVVLLVLGLAGGADASARYAWWSLMFGVLVFSGSLYVLSVTGVRWLGAITPIGGLLMLIGWLLIAIRRWPRSQA